MIVGGCTPNPYDTTYFPFRARRNGLICSGIASTLLVDLSGQRSGRLDAKICEPTCTGGGGNAGRATFADDRSAAGPLCRTRAGADVVGHGRGLPAALRHGFPSSPCRAARGS